ncbi:uncharacterized protein LOC107657426 [Sinocyclocheilus anshuiensis]|uniref:uncharacterized protein LOC107657426 n=1 Tax=Sinocyclocheilus anshuiensis TaxID=1608454 RepID=UPI0007B79752|nr:PREDICTED: uncharacterized protein LOC107657426 [Sinocyclocheilus anshuiensis]
MMFLYIYIVLLLEMPAVLGVSLDQGQKALIKTEGKTVYLPCKVTGQSYIHWYQMKDGEAPSRLLYISQRGDVTRDTNNPQANDFTVDKTKLYDLKLSDTQKSHAAAYFCAYWDSSSHMGNWIKRFGSGTRLVVTDPKKEIVTVPELTGYRPSKKNTDIHGKQTMLCHASGMVPDFVTFKWQEKSGAGQWTDVSEENVLEQRKESPAVTVTSMMIVDKNMAENKDYQCIVTHEGNTENPSKSLEMKKENSKPAKESKNDAQNPTCSPSTEETIKKQISGDSEQIPSMFLFVYAYGVLLMKNGLFFCIVSMFQLKRKAGKKDKSSET